MSANRYEPDTEYTGTGDYIGVMVKDEMGDWVRFEHFANLYNAVNELMATLGAYGEIDPRSDDADRVMSALHAIDGGIYTPMVTTNTTPKGG